MGVFYFINSMETNLSPVLFNAWKHHWHFIKKEIYSDIYSLNTLHEKIKIIGHSVLDLYIGNLSIENIFQEIIAYLQAKKYFENEAYLKWLAQNKNYQEIELSDSSIWTFLKGNETDKYIHIHPSRYSPFTIRSNANSLKTAILSMLYIKQNQFNSISLEIINTLRQDWLELSPIRTLGDASKIRLLINIK